jgi:predicted RNA-binding protein with TRAM domain
VGKHKKTFNDHPFAYHEEVELEIATLTNHGVGLARYTRAGGTEPVENWVVMVPFTLPGERVRARVFRNHKNYSEADLVEVLTRSPAPERVLACPLFGRCGGCQYQHLAYGSSWSGNAGRWRSCWRTWQASRTFRSRRWSRRRGSFTTAPRSPRISPPRRRSPRCRSAFCARARVSTRRRAALPDRDRGDQRAPHAVRADVHARQDSYVRGRRCCCARRRSGDDRLRRGHRRDSVGPLAPRCACSSPGIFPEQPVHPAGLHRRGARPGRRQRRPVLVDAYCGSGLFALSAAAAFEQVAGVEISATSVRLRPRERRRERHHQRHLHRGRRGRIFAGLTCLPPPRPSSSSIRRARAATSSSCHNFSATDRAPWSTSPATPPRRCATCGPSSPRATSWTAVQPFDLFPQTRHLECIVTLRKSPAVPKISLALE